MKPSKIEDDTPILPHVVADGVLAECSKLIGRKLPRSMADELANRAQALYNCNTQIRAGIRRGGDGGRDYLTSFMRHWISSKVVKRWPEVRAKLPDSFVNGVPD